MHKLRAISALAAFTAAGCGTTGPVTENHARYSRPLVASSETVPGQRDDSRHGTSAGTIRLVQAEAPAAPQVPFPPPATSSEASPRELQPGVGEVFVPPPAVPPVPPTMETWRAVESETDRQSPIGLEELEQLACSHNPTLGQAKAQVEAVFGMAIQAGLWPNPEVFYMGRQVGVENTPGEFQGGRVQQEIVTADKRDLSRAEFLERTTAAEWQAMVQEYRVLNDVRMHFFRTLGRQELVRIHSELLKNAEDRLVTTREMYNVGQVTRADVHLANQQLQEARLMLLMAQNDLITSWQTLTAFAGVDLPLRELAGPLDEGLELIEWDEALERVLTESPELQQAYANLRADTVQLKREKVEPVPNLIVSGGAGYNYPSEETVGFAQLNFKVPIFDWNQGTVRQAEADVVRQRLEIERVELRLRQELSLVYRNYLTALQHVQNFQEVILPEARRAYEVELDSYEDDRAPWIDVLDLERNYFLQREIYVRNLMLWRENEVLIVGYLLHGALTSPEGPVPPGHIQAVPQPR